MGRFYRQNKNEYKVLQLTSMYYIYNELCNS